MAARMTFLGIHPPVVVGTIEGINKEPDALTMLAEKPLDSRVQSGGRVLVQGSLWPSINGRWFEVAVVAVPLSQFRLLGCDTTGEVGVAAGTVAVRETRTYVPPPDPPPVFLDTTTGIEKAVAPHVALENPPLDARVQNGDAVMVTESGWASVDGQWWPVEVVDRPAALFKLLGADTTGEGDSMARASVWRR